MSQTILFGESVPRQIEEITRLVNGVNLQRLGNHPVPLSAEELRRLYEQIVK